MKYKIALGVIVLVAVAGVAYAQFFRTGPDNAQTENTQQTEQPVTETTETEQVEEKKVVQEDPKPQPDHFSTEEDVDIMYQPEVFEVRILPEEFSPGILTIKKGDYVQFVNTRTDANLHVISDPHFSNHSALPGLNSGVLKPGENFRYQFTKVGTWGYHDEMYQKIKGQIIVE